MTTTITTGTSAWRFHNRTETLRGRVDSINSPIIFDLRSSVVISVDDNARSPSIRFSDENINKTHLKKCFLTFHVVPN